MHFHVVNVRHIYQRKLHPEKCFELEVGEFCVTSTRTLKIYRSTIGVRNLDVSYSCAVIIHALDYGLVPSIGRAQTCYTGASRLDCLHIVHLWQLYMK